MALVSFFAASLALRWAQPEERVPLAIALVLSLVYSLPPIRLCARPIVDLAANAAGYGGIAFLVGHLATGGELAAGMLAAAPYVALVGATFLHTTILDVEGDRATGKITSTVMLGIRASQALALVLALGGLVWAGAAAWLGDGDPLAAIVLLVATPAFVVALGRAASSNVVQFATLVVAAAAAFVEPLYLVLLVPLALAARYYYRARFGLDYPGTVTGRSVTGS
jgi:1,4-dihydroxy-2-naphthoate octaprenyltransferase